MPDKEKISNFRFTFNGNIITELGEESISNPNVAMAELIKNAYDADSTNVSVDFLDKEKHNASIKISDDGIGMGLSDIKDRFMDIGSPHKRAIVKTDTYHRVPVGAKGIGRFASHSLGHKMILFTKSKLEKNGYELEFDWSKFSDSSKATDIDIETWKMAKNKMPHGTSLEIKELKGSWNDKDKIKSLLRDLNLLISPTDPPKKFKIKENIGDKSVDLPKIKKDFFDKSAYSFKVSLTKKKIFSFEFFKLGKLIKKEKKELSKGLSCGDAKFELYFYYKTPDSWKRNTGAEIVGKDLEYIRSVLNEYGGIKLYRDHFRVKPYGDKEADWIGLDQWSRNASDIPGNTQIFGTVSISKANNPQIEDTTTREGVINNSEYYDLVDFITTAIREFVVLRNAQEKGRVKGHARKSKIKTIKVQKSKVTTSNRPDKSTQLIDVKTGFPSTHYNQIVYEANECHEKNYPNASFWMCRKIIENLVTHILEKKYPKQPDLWFDTSRNRTLNFSHLIENLYNNRSDFTSPGVKDKIETFNTDVSIFRKAVNSSVHNNHDYLTDKDELKKFKINKIIQTLVDIYLKS